MTLALTSSRASLPTLLRPRRLWWFASRLWRKSPYPMRVRWKWARAGGEGDSFAYRSALVRDCLARDAEGKPYYEIGGKKLYFLPHFTVSEDECLTGIELILRETYLGFDLEEEPVIARPGDTVIDMGANIGTNALYFADKVGPTGKVLAFEPVMHAPLAKNVGVNGAAGIVEVIPKAVGDHEGHTQIGVRMNCIDSRIADAECSPDAPSSQPAPEEEDGGPDIDFANDGVSHRDATRLDIDITTLDRVVEQRGLSRVDLIKVDIEGAEELAMRGAHETVKRFRPKWTISSYHTDFTGQPQHPKLVRLLKEWGYTVREHDRRRIVAW